MDPMQFITSVAVGAAVAGIAWTNQSNYVVALDWVERDLRSRLRTLHISAPHLRLWMNAWLVIVAGTSLAIWIAFEAAVFGLVLCIGLASGPWYLVLRLSQRRRQMIEDQLADAMVMFSSAVRAGLSLAQSLELLARECPRPIHQEFQQIIGEYKLGKPIERTLEEAKERLRSENFVLFAAALLASRESGGRLNETVERISQSVVELQRLERKVMSETAQARKSAVYMAIVPLVLLIVYFFVDPRNTELLFVTLPGQVMLSLSLVLNVLAYLWALRILRADI